MYLIGLKLKVRATKRNINALLKAYKDANQSQS